MDRGGNMVSKIPSNALSQVKFKGRKIIIPYNGKRYVIVRCKMIMKRMSRRCCNFTTLCDADWMIQ